MTSRIIQVRRSRNERWKKHGGWEAFEAEGVQPVCCGETGRQNALDYAQQSAHSGICDIQVLDEHWKVVETITNEDLKPIV